jgi:hypothetical protein
MQLNERPILIMQVIVKNRLNLLHLHQDLVIQVGLEINLILHQKAIVARQNQNQDLGQVPDLPVQNRLVQAQGRVQDHLVHDQVAVN